MNWQSNFFKSFDGTQLHYRYSSSCESAETTVVHLHRGHEHSERVIPFAESLQLDQSQHFAFDLRGHGHSEGETAWAENFQVWVKDLNEFVSYLQNHRGVKKESIIIVANSVGAVMATSWILRYNPKIAGCILGAPAFSINLYVPFALSSLRLLKVFTKKAFVTSYVKSTMLTHSKEEANAYDLDPIITKKIGVNILVTLFDEAKWILSRSQDFETPVLILSAEKDYVVRTKPQKSFFENCGSQIKRFISLPNSKHAVFHETNKAEIARICNSFISEIFSHQAQSKALTIIPPPRPHTLEEFAHLSKRGGQLKRLKFFISRKLIQSLGSWSEGMRLGLKAGFNSGESLDYVYSNQTKGSNIIGRFIDYFYLNSLGWREVRKRKDYLADDIKKALIKVRNSGQQPVVLDIACGNGRYLSEALKDDEGSIHLHLNDRDDNCLSSAKDLVLDSIKNPFLKVTQSNIDIFDNSSLELLDIKPNIIIVSGVIELYPDNNQVHRCFKTLYNKAAPEAQFLYTGQPWHPQLELIGRTLNNKEGRRWVMRRRIQSEMDELVESSGFYKIDTKPNDTGIFTVSKAIKAHILEENHGH